MWHWLQLPGLDLEALHVVEQMRLRHNRTGDAVRSADPEKGPFTDLEFAGIVGAVNNGFAAGDIGVEDYVLVWLLLALGARPIQLATLKLSDFSVVRASDGAMAYLLDVPRAKQQGDAPRTQFKRRPLLPEIGPVVVAHCEATLARWRELGIGADENAPFFINPDHLDAIPVLRCHCTGDDLARRVQEIFNTISVTSERTGCQLTVNTRRFRYTVGTRAAREGASELVIAETLDHSDTQSVGVYVEAVPDIVERIDRAMAMHLAPMAQAFVGMLIEDEDDATRGDDPRSRIVRPEDVLHPIGNCGHYGFCGAMAPVACYTCRNFQPWVDAPHAEVLEQLLAERDRIMQETGDVTIAAVNDRLIVACAEVVRLCEARKAGESL